MNLVAEQSSSSAQVPDGLSTAEAVELLRQNGENRLPPPVRVPAWRRLLSEMVHFFALMLWVAGGLAFVAGMPQLGVAIFIVVLVNGLFAFAQAQRAEHAAEQLRELLPIGVLVRRDGHKQTIDATQLVLGDLVILAAGDRVAADLSVLEANGLSADESMLSGESEPLAIEAGAPLWAGTFVVNGSGLANVTATGSSTKLAGLSVLTSTVQRPKSPLAQELDRIVRVMALVTIAVGVAFFLVSLMVGIPATDGFLFAVGVTVALVPEGLLPTVTLSLAMGAQRMARKQALVRHLEAVETLGSTTFICTDKTGTLTRNEMSVVEAWTPSGSIALEGVGYSPSGRSVGSAEAKAAAFTMAQFARACSTGRAIEADGVWSAAGDPMEAAIDAFYHRCRIGGADDPEVRDRYPFDSIRRRESVEFNGWLVTKGAPESVLPLCPDSADAFNITEAMAARGLRVLAVGRRPIDEVSATATALEAEDNLELVGLIALHDPPRAEVADALAQCRSAGIRVAMLTGDHPATARAIAERVGLLGPEGLVILGSELPEDEVELGTMLDHDGVVLSRVNPEDKMRIARALQRRGHVVAMTGDGVNDGPALREADIGIAMGRSGTDVAREAADLVLLDDNFATIIAAVEQGRATFTNIRRFLTYHLTDNVAELTPFLIWALSGGKFPLAIGVLQVLCLDIATDLLPALALGAEPATDGVLERPLTGRHMIDGSLVRRVFGVLGPVEALMEMSAFLVGLWVAGWRPGEAFPSGHALMAASGAAFAAVVLGQAANALACRSATHPPWQLSWRSNPLLIGAIAVQILLLVGLLWIGPVARLLGHAPPPLSALALAMATMPALLLVDALHKRIRASRRP